MLARFAPPGTMARRVLVWTALVGAVLLYTQLYLVGDSQAARGTPFAILFQGLLVGLMNALAAAGIILIYRTNRIINFAATSIGLVALIFVLNMTTYNPSFPFWLSLLLGLALAGMVGALIDLVFGRRFARAPRLVFTIMTIAGAEFLNIIALSFVVKLPFFPPEKERAPAIDFAPARIRRLLPFAGFKFSIGSVNIKFGFAEVLAIVLSVVALAGLAMFFRWSKSGIAVRAASQNAERAALLGIGVGALSTLVWAIAGVLSGINLVAAGLMNDPAGFGRGTTALLAPLTAAVLARMESLPVAVAVSMLIGVATLATSWTYSNSTAAISVGMFAVIMIGLVLQRRSLFRASISEDESSWEATAEPRAVPKELRGLRTLQLTRYALLGVALLLLGLLPFMFAVRIQNLLGVIALFTIVGLSLVVLTGWSGQVSLGQFGFVAVGAAVSGALSANLHWSFWLAVPVATIATALVAGVIGLPALRIRGLYLAVATFAFGDAVSELFSSPRYLQNHLPRSVERPALFFIDFNDDRSMYFLCVAALLLTVLVLINLRKSRFGRLLIAARENEANVQSFGVGLVRLKVSAFVVSGAMAGFAGAIYAFQQRSVNGTGYGIDRSLNVFIFTVLGGVSSAGGALIGSAYGNLSNYFLQQNALFQLLVGSLPLVILFIEPAGVIAIVNRVRDSWLRIVAQRRQIVVPSLFADYDADMLSRRLIPMGAPVTGQGLGALESDERFTLESAVHQRPDGNGGAPAATATREATAIVAASGASEGEGEE